MTQPALFISHGAPNLALHKTPAHDFLKHLGRDLPRPSAILVASAHFATRAPALSSDAKPDTIHDFGRGFEAELFAMHYDASGNPVLAKRAAKLLEQAGLAPSLAENRGFDHGTWVPLILMYPDADIPVVQVSVQPQMGPAHHLALGAALAPLRDEGVLIIGSGAITHNLHELFGGGYGLSDPAPDWVHDFGDWAHERIEAGDRDDLIHYRARGPNAVRNHPTDEHLLPLFVTMGAAGHGQRVHSSEQYGVLMMDAYRFD
jgi:4,5-DOPA dioxygenase extradiol